MIISQAQISQSEPATSIICVSIGRGRHKMLMQEHAELAQQGVQLVELRLDYIRRSVDLKRLLTDRPTPVIATCRRPNDGGKWRGSERDRLMLLRTAVADGADYVDLEMDVADQIPRYGKTKRIVSYHNFRETPENLDEIHTQMRQLDPDVIKITTMANAPEDNLRVLRLCRDSQVPTVAFCMGEIGTPSRLLCGRFGAPFSYATFSDERALAPGQLSFQLMNQLYRYPQINRETQIFGVIADPVGHSLSPLVHNRGFQAMGLNAVYLPFRIPREHLAAFIEQAPELGIRGLSVTIPHKEEVVQLATRIDPEVAGIGAANTLVFENDEIIASNTDCIAAVQCLERAIRGEDRDATDVLKGKRVLILGSGGVARALAFGLKQHGAEVTITGRSTARTEALAKELDVKAIDWLTRSDVKVDVIVNGTPLGMHPHVDDSPLEPDALKSHMIVFDTVYNPEQTLLIKRARAAGCQVVTGTEMFVRQAALQFQRFTGQKISKNDMLTLVRRAISPVRYDES